MQFRSLGCVGDPCIERVQEHLVSIFLEIAESVVAAKGPSSGVIQWPVAGRRQLFCQSSQVILQSVRHVSHAALTQPLSKFVTGCASSPVQVGVLGDGKGAGPSGDSKAAAQSHVCTTFCPPCVFPAAPDSSPTTCPNMCHPPPDVCSKSLGTPRSVVLGIAMLVHREDVSESRFECG